MSKRLSLLLIRRLTNIFFFSKKKTIIDALESQVNDIKNMLKTLIKTNKGGDENQEDIEMSDVNQNRNRYSSSQNSGIGSAIYRTESEDRGRSRKRVSPKTSRAQSKKRSNRGTKSKGRSNRSLSSSSTESSSPSQRGQWLFYDDLSKNLKTALRVTYLFRFIYGS